MTVFAHPPVRLSDRICLLLRALLASVRSSRLLVALALAFALSAAAPQAALAQTDSQDLPGAAHLPKGVQAQIERSLSGPDFSGKDGPLQAIGPHLATLYYEHRWHRRKNAGRPFEPTLKVGQVRDGYVTIDATAVESGRVLLDQLRSVGLRNGAQAGPVVSGRIPIDRLAEVASLPALRRARPSVALGPRPARSEGGAFVPPGMRAGSAAPKAGPGIGGKIGNVDSQGDLAMKTDEARDLFDTNGSGVTVGVISDSYDTADNPTTDASQDIQQGDLPGPGNPNGFETPTDVLQDNQDSNSDEGRAMMQIIHDVAPGAGFAFHTGIGVGRAGFAQAVRDLRNEGDSDVIVDDIGLFLEPMFQDGVVTDAIEDVTDDGAVYLSSAGNSGTQGYGDRFRGMSIPGRLNPANTPHNFEGGDDLQDVRIPVDATAIVILQWDDPYSSPSGPGNAEADLDFYLTDKEGNNVVARGNIDNNGGATTLPSDPAEFFQFENTGSIDADGDGESDEVFQLGIELVDGPEPDFMRYVIARGGTPIEYVDDQPDNPADGPATLYGHTNAPSCISVGASFYQFGPEFSDTLDRWVVNSFSSRSGIPILFDDDGNRLDDPVLRAKPDVTGPDGVNTTFFGFDAEGDGAPNFFGTSAAAPHLAGVAALIRSADPNAPAQRIETQLEATALDIRSFAVVSLDPIERDISDAATIGGTGGVGPDRRSGSGFVDASEAVRQFAEILEFSADVATDGDGGLSVSWEELESADIESYTLRRRYVDAPPGVTAATDTSIALEPSREYNVPFPDASPGRYEFTLSYVRADGTTGQTSTVSTIVPLSQAASADGPFPNPVRGQPTTLRVTSKSTQDVQIELFDSVGRRVGIREVSLQANRPRNLRLGTTAFNFNSLASGIYFIRVRGDDFSLTRRLSVVR